VEILDSIKLGCTSVSSKSNVLQSRKKAGLVVGHRLGNGSFKIRIVRSAQQTHQFVKMSHPVLPQQSNQASLEEMIVRRFVHIARMAKHAGNSLLFQKAAKKSPEKSVRHRQ
jgi:hypothetical protein